MLRPGSADGAYSALPDPLASLRGPTSKGEGREKGKKREMGKEGKERGTGPFRKFLYPPRVHIIVGSWHISDNKNKYPIIRVSS